MAWIKILSECEADGELAELYSQEGSAWGADSILKIHSLNPPSLRAHLAVFKTLMYGRSGLSRIQREMIGTVVSTINRCRY